MGGDRLGGGGPRLMGVTGFSGGGRRWGARGVTGAAVMGGSAIEVGLGGGR